MKVLHVGLAKADGYQITSGEPHANLSKGYHFLAEMFQKVIH
jgi:hypothetical protein